MPRNAAGSDVGAAGPWVAVPCERDAPPVPRFGALTADLYAWAEWRRQCPLETVVMESPGVSGMALFAVLAERGCDGKLVEAHDARPGPGRKTDVEDGPWLPELHPDGLRRGAFRPDEQVCGLRSSLRQRRRRVAMASRAGQQMPKALEQRHLQLPEVVRDRNGKTGRERLHAILAGERDPQRLASDRARRCPHEQATIAKALEGHGRAEPRLAWQQALEQYALLPQQVQGCAQQIDACRQTCVTHVAVAPPQPTLAHTRRARQRQAPRFEVHTSLDALTGVDLTQMDGMEA